MKHSSIIILFLMAFISSCGQSPNKDVALTESKSNLEVLDNYMNNLEKEGVYGSFLFMENDKILFEKSIGYANKEKGIKSHKLIIYPFGSIVKDYTRTVILLLAAEELFNLDDPLSKFYYNIPEDKKKITIAQLLQHRSGLLAYHDNIPELREKYKGIPADLYPGTKEEALGYIFNQKLKFEPGADESYSNSGYTLLAYLIEDLTKKNFDTVVREKIFEPANMTSTDFYQSPLWKPEDVAIGYGRSKFGKENSAYYWPRNPNQLIGNGGVSGTLDDLYKGVKYLMYLENNHKKFNELSKKYPYIEGMPNDIVGSSGGGNLGNVTTYFGIVSKNQYLLFASNNDDDGMEDVAMLRDVTKMAFNFDIASLAPEEFQNNNGEEESELSQLSTDTKKSKWGLPDKLKYKRLGALLDVVSNQMSIDTFTNENCTSKFSKKVKKFHQSWPKSNSITFDEVASYGAEMDLIVKDTLTDKTFKFEVKMDRGENYKFKSIKLKK
ncbi:serine hydrolase [uncultured Psychroserpens sp.]|uniref:serine hydrolase domain-containing protein n=1 Tax=uncultured Psychroserpens sp. TaxID=255436 RepID=UPI00261CBCF8|nr:serine hydrolase domain-containing protein [uncultured Psychroserpens sp.]